MFRLRLLSVALFWALLVACVPLDPVVDSAIVETARPTLTAVSPTLSPSPIPTLLPTTSPTNSPTNQDMSAPVETPTPPPSPAPPLQLGAGYMLGRGRILDADFSEDGRILAVAWAAGVSLVNVADAQEIWWQPLDVPLIALDMQAREQTVAVAMVNGTVMVITAAGITQTYTVSNDGNHLGDIVWSPDNSEIAVQFLGPTNQSRDIFRLTVTTGEVSIVPSSRIGTGVRPYLLWSPDGTLLPVVALGEDCTQLIDVPTGEVRFNFRQDTGCYGSHGMAWSPDGRFLALDNLNGAIELVTVPDGNLVRQMAGSIRPFAPTSSGQPLFFSPDGRFLAGKGGAGFYSESYPTTVWQVETGEMVSQTDTLFEDRISSAFIDDGLVTLHADGSLIHWDFADTGQEILLGQLPTVMADHFFTWSADGHYLAARRHQNGLVIGATTIGQELTVLEGQLAAPAFSPDGHLLAVTDLGQSQLLIYDLASGQIKYTLPGATAELEGVAFAPDGQQVAYGVGNEVVIADVASGLETAVLTGYPADQTITQIKWSADGTAILAASGLLAGDEVPGVVVLWQQTAIDIWAEQFRVENVRTTYSGQPIALFNPTSDLVAFESLPRPEAGLFQIFVYDRQQEAIILTLSEYQLAAWQGENMLLTSEAQYNVLLTRWDVATGEKVTGLATEYGDNVYSPDGAFFAQPTYNVRDIEVRAWATNQLVAQAQVERNIIWIGWSPDGRFLAAYASDGALQVWPVIK